MKTQVVTYTSDRNNKLSVCPACEAHLSENGQWPKDRHGSEYATVSHGLHSGRCDWCQRMTEAEARRFVLENTDDSDLSDEEIERAFVAIFGRHPDAEDREQGLWSLLCQAIDD